MSLLDEIVIIPPPLAATDPLASHTDLQALQCLEKPVDQATKSTYRLLPWLLASTTPVQAGANWVELCRQFKSFGLAIQCSALDFESVPIEAAPLRIAKQFIEQPFSEVEFKSADVIELALYSECKDQWGFPPELGPEKNLIELLESVRMAAGKTTAIALGIPVGLDAPSIETTLAARPDILCLDASGSKSDELIIASLSRIRASLQKNSFESVPIVLRSQHSEPEQLVKLLALGASVVAIDKVFDSLWTTKAEVPSGFLSTVHTGPNRPGINETSIYLIQSRIQSLNTVLLRSLDFTSHSPLAQLRERLRAISDRAARLARIPFLEG